MWQRAWRSVMSAAVACCIAAPLVATERTTDDAIARGRELYQAGYFDQAIAPLDSAARDTGAPAKQRADALQMLGVSHMALGDEFEAKRAFARLLAVQPDHVLPDSLSPKVHAVFQQVRQQMLELTGVELRHVGIGRVAPGEPVDAAVQVLAVDPAQYQLSLNWRPEGGDRFTSVVMAYASASRSHGVSLSAAQLGDPAIGAQFQYYIEALGPDATVVGRVGGPRAPLRFTVEPATEATAIWQTWWFWTTIGVGLAAAGVTVAAVVWSANRPGAADPCAGATLDCVQAP